MQQSRPGAGKTSRSLRASSLPSQHPNYIASIVAKSLVMPERKRRIFENLDSTSDKSLLNCTKESSTTATTKPAHRHGSLSPRKRRAFMGGAEPAPEPVIIADVPKDAQVDVPKEPLMKISTNDDSHSLVDKLMGPAPAYLSTGQAPEISLPLSERFRPVALKNVVGHRHALEKARSWMESRTKGAPGPKILLLNGPPGIGKTTMATCMLKDYGYNIKEVNASDTRTGDKVAEIITQYSTAKGLKGKVGVILDELDGLFLKPEFGDTGGDISERGGFDAIGSALMKLPHHASPIIATCNRISGTKMRKFVAQHCTEIKMYPLYPRELMEVAKSVVSTRGGKLMEYSTESLQEMCSTSRGDLRQLLQNLHLAELNGLSDTSVDTFDTLFTGVERLWWSQGATYEDKFSIVMSDPTVFIGAVSETVRYIDSRKPGRQPTDTLDSISTLCSNLSMVDSMGYFNPTVPNHVGSAVLVSTVEVCRSRGDIPTGTRGSFPTIGFPKVLQKGKHVKFKCGLGMRELLQNPESRRLIRPRLLIHLESLGPFEKWEYLASQGMSLADISMLFDRHTFNLETDSMPESFTKRVSQVMDSVRSVMAKSSKSRSYPSQNSAEII